MTDQIVDRRTVGIPGATGPAARIASVTSESVAADHPASVVVGGTDLARTLHFLIPRGLPASDAVPQDTAVATFVAGAETATRAALQSSFASHITPIVGETPAATVARINAALQMNRVVRLFGKFTINAPLVVPSDTTLDATGATVTLVGGSDCNMLQNAGVTAAKVASDAAMTSGQATLESPTLELTDADVGSTVIVEGAASAGLRLVANIVSVVSGVASLSRPAGQSVASAQVALYRRDQNVTIVGGTWNRGGNLGTGSALHSVLLRHVDNGHVHGMNITSTAGKYAVSVGDCTKLTVDHVRGRVASDGVHLMGPLDQITVRDVKGTFGDDIVAITARDWPAYSDVGGPVTNVVISDIAGTTTAASAIILAGSDAPVSGVHIHDVGGTSLNGTRGAIMIGNDAEYPETATGRIDDVLIENVRTVTPKTAPMVRIEAIGGVGNLRLEGFTQQVAQNVVVTLTDTSTIDTLSITKSVALVTGAVSFINCQGKIGRLIIDDVQAATNTGLINMNGALASIGELRISHLTMALPSTSGNVVKAITTGQTLTSLVVADSQLTNISSIADLATNTTVTVTGTIATGMNQVVYGRSGAALVIGGDMAGLLPLTSGVLADKGVASLVLTARNAIPSPRSFSVTPGAGAGDGATIVSSGTSTQGAVRVNLGSAPAAGEIATVTIPNAFPWVTASPVISPLSRTGGKASLYVSEKRNGSFTVSALNAPSGTSLEFAFILT